MSEKKLTAIITLAIVFMIAGSWSASVYIGPPASYPISALIGIGSGAAIVVAIIRYADDNNYFL